MNTDFSRVCGDKGRLTKAAARDMAAIQGFRGTNRRVKTGGRIKARPYAYPCPFRACGKNPDHHWHVGHETAGLRHRKGRSRGSLAA